LLSNHLQFWNSIGYEYDTSVVTELAKPSQEALMKLFAVSSVQFDIYRREILDKLNIMNNLKKPWKEGKYSCCFTFIVSANYYF
jgi:hypothetical protein